MLLSRLVAVLVLMPTSPRKMLMPQGAPRVQDMMCSAMAFMAFINLLYYKDLHNEVGSECFLAGQWLC